MTELREIMIGKEIHHYKILEKFGEGGTGVIYIKPRKPNLIESLLSNSSASFTVAVSDSQNMPCY